MKYRKRKSKIKYNVRRLLFVAIPVLLAVFSVTGYILSRRPDTGLRPGDGMLTVDFIDVGQGDAALVEAPDGQFMLIDAGPPESADRLLSWLDMRGVRKIRYAVFTHPHADHIGGGDEVMLTYKVQTVLMPESEFDIPSFYRLRKALDFSGCEIISPAPGDSFEFGGATVKIYAPDGEIHENLNDMSIVLRVEYGATSVMFTGDAEEISENIILDTFRASELKSDILKVGHHGSSTSSTARFLQAVSPEYAVISCGKNNDYGHPHAVTLRKLRDIGASVLRTDEIGTVTFVSDGSVFSCAAE